MNEDLNKLRWKEYDGNHPNELDRISKSINTGGILVESHFKDIRNKLISKIKKYNKGIIFGCVAWLTDFYILDELARVKDVQIIVQKEDFLRPDLGVDDEAKFNEELQKKYTKINFSLTKSDMKYGIDKLSYCWEPKIEAIRCLGNYNFENKSAFPRCHHKFLVFCELEKNINGTVKNYLPKAVWTGSFNFTKNSGSSLENAIYIESDNNNNNIIESYLKEHHFAFGLSEKLDWSSKWIEPQFKIGS